ncbi:hypothetical protein BDV96DRAFT_590534 [Lophiotrema nucula]|uniref:Uncharacterized protein n=1 Tax=Lophiotrema nucula TaxID=690887 RepID=A0A6A5YIB8_9PLEO|nr:hypothetical protein BDV96DRAFT_590534 [Lophiotrema nucula]
MVILGGLEFVVGGYLVHKHYKNKSEKKRLQEEALRRRNNTFPGAKPRPYAHPQTYPAPKPEQKYASYAQPPHQPQPHYQAPPITPQHMPLRHPLPPHAQSEPPYQPNIQPLRRQQSFASLSHMPVANGSQPHDVYPPVPPGQSPLNTQYTHPSQQHNPNYPYYNTGFSASYPSFEPTLVGPEQGSNQHSGRHHTMDDNWEQYGPPSPHVHFAVSDAPQPGERDDDPPPPYRP